MKLSLGSMERVNFDGSHGTKVTKLLCSKRKSEKCNFFFEFRFDPAKNTYQLNKYKDIHNHTSCDHDYSSSFTKLLERIRVLAPDQVKKIKDEEYGTKATDADTLIKMLQDDAKRRKSYYKAGIRIGIFKQCSFMTQRMKKVTNRFNNVIIIDIETRHKPISKIRRST